MLKERKSVELSDCWNLKQLYSSDNTWTLELENTKKLPITELEQLKGRLTSSASTLATGLQLYFSILRNLEKLHVYAHLRHDEDLKEESHKSMYGRIQILYSDFQEKLAWIEPEIIYTLNKELLNTPELASYKFYLESLLRLRAHTLSTDQEILISQSTQALATSYNVFRNLSDVDLPLGFVLDSEGKELPLTHGTYSIYLKKEDRTLRKNTFLKMHSSFSQFQNTLCESLQGCVQKHLFNTKARKYPDCLTAAIYDKNIDVAVYKNLITTVKENIHILHEYTSMRKQFLGLENLHLYDMNIPLVSKPEDDIPYDTACTWIVEASAPLGAEYQNILYEGLTKRCWVDRYENLHKRSGAYSSGCYDSEPYILMNYNNDIRDVFTLMHEAGHSMHSFLSNKNQPYHYANYSIFVAEVASTFNEDLLHRYLMKKSSSAEEKRYLISQSLEDIRGTLFRQCQFAEFELFIHEKVEQGEPLTPKLLNDKYIDLVREYYGPSLSIDNEVAVEWARIPHFYYNFYVYQYATGISAALALVKQVLENGGSDYLKFLQMGCSRFPIDALKAAGVDVRSPKPVLQAMHRFQELTQGFACES